MRGINKYSTPSKKDFRSSSTLPKLTKKNTQASQFLKKARRIEITSQELEEFADLTYNENYFRMIAPIDRNDKHSQNIIKELKKTKASIILFKKVIAIFKALRILKKNPKIKKEKEKIFLESLNIQEQIFAHCIKNPEQ